MNAIEKLRTERQRLVARLAEIDKILGQYEELQRIAESYLTTEMPHKHFSDSGYQQGVSGETLGSRLNAEMPRVVDQHKSKTPMAEFEKVVVEVLSETHEPLDRSALYKALMARDVVIGSPDERSDLNTLSARMSRMKENIVNVTGFGYWLKERAFAPGGHAPQVIDATLSMSGKEDHNFI